MAVGADDGVGGRCSGRKIGLFSEKRVVEGGWAVVLRKETLV